MAIETTPAFLRGLKQFEDHRERRPVGQPTLRREFGKRFGDRAYAAEELVAELCFAFLCAEFDIDGELRHAGYIEGWIALLKDDSRAFFTAASAAQKAADYLRSQVLAAEMPIAA
ncbi:zincin-like metallopeptidase domain-containing protein [Bradyrhizobium neotropicale]|uniref:zincin-like metallopeptidase domain-containing protein n=1 Tax=Bradyrhizobium neotropicale TaxID=1497615 RepID=UPI001AD6EB8E|nr:zincin-like metallopeptidase domain-containing protein [Bradyrhizobium neotropicale]